MTNAKTFLEKRYSDEMALEDAVHTSLLTLKEGFEGQVSGSNIEVRRGRTVGRACFGDLQPTRRFCGVSEKGHVGGNDCIAGSSSFSLQHAAS
jgi:hypothetical protein